MFSLYFEQRILVMSRIFKKFKELFIVEDSKAEGTLDAELRTKTEKKEDVAQTESNGNTVSEVPVEQVGEVNHKFLELLFNALEENNLDGYDYLEYKKSLQYLKKMDMDEKTRYQSAFASARPMGATKKVLLDSAKFYIDILAKERNQFEEAFQNQSKKQILGNEKKKKALAQSIKQQEQKILEIQKDIEKKKVELAEIEEKLKTASVKVGKTKSDFMSSYEYLVNQIKSDATKINGFID